MPQRQLVFVGSSIDDLRSFPEDVKDVVGYALWLAQEGQKHPDAKPLKGFGGAGVLEIADTYRGDAYRVIYTTAFADVVYVLHAFKKKSTSGIATPKSTSMSSNDGSKMPHRFTPKGNRHEQGIDVYRKLRQCLRRPWAR